MIERHTTLPAKAVEPYVHADERGVVFHDGRHTVIWPQARMRFLVETLAIIAVDRRATRSQHEWALGGFATATGVTLYASDPRGAISLSISRESFDELRDALARYLQLRLESTATQNFAA